MVALQRDLESLRLLSRSRVLLPKLFITRSKEEVFAVTYRITNNDSWEKNAEISETRRCITHVEIGHFYILYVVEDQRTRTCRRRAGRDSLTLLTSGQRGQCLLLKK